MASILISENIGKVLYLAIPLGFIGVYIILDLPFVYHDSVFHTTDLTIAIIGSFLTGLAYVMVRMASNLKESPYVIMFYFPLFTVPLSFVLTYNVWSQPTIDIWIVLILVGICSQLGQIFLTFGYKLLPAGRAATTSYIQVPFSAIAGMLIFHENVSYNFIIGSMVIFYTIFIIVREKVK